MSYARFQGHEAATVSMVGYTGHQRANSRGLYTNYEDSLLKVG